MNQPVGLVDGEPDDAPVRAGGVFLVALPFTYVLLAVMSHAVGCLLVQLRFAPLPRFVGASAAIAALVSIPFSLGLGSPMQFGVMNAAVSVSVAICLFVCCAVPGALCWWYLGVRGVSRVAAEPQIETTSIAPTQRQMPASSDSKNGIKGGCS
jgi:hypothetical protein